MSEYSSREIPSGFRALMFVGFFGCEGPAVALLSGIDSALRISAAETAMTVQLEERYDHVDI